MAFVQLIGKSFSIVTNDDGIKTLFLWIHNLHQAYESDLITSLAIPVLVIVAIGEIYFVILNGLLIFAIPGLPQKNEFLIYQHINQAINIMPSTIAIVLYDTILISIGLYFISSLDIFHDMITCLDDSKLRNKSQFVKMCYTFHCELLTILDTFNYVFSYTLTVQAVTSFGFLLFVFYLIKIPGAIALFPLLLAIFAQFGALCLFGQVIFTKSERIFVTLYLTKWYEFNLNDQKLMLMMMKICGNSLGFKAAGIYDINLMMFIQGVKFGFSYCALIYSLSLN
ncbi:uncharacterized protein LOC132264395 [Phlebotomus argentipes]|uniref:uncharacterized protein LOC132264395 n=1 Tax=Phlebotomus argentipes TaxID=94469 RepID=UPI00289301F1|nr:uncharacterized protein LOC132264395 [Phlebotomus argentipes]